MLCLLMIWAIPIGWTVWTVEARANNLPENVTRPTLDRAPLAEAEIETLLANANLHLERQQPGLALQLYRQVPETSWFKSRALLGEGCCHFALGKYERSVYSLKDMQTHLERQEDSSGVNADLLATGLELLAQDYMFLGRTGQARSVLEDLEEQFPERRSFCLVQVARCHLQDGSFHTAFEVVVPILEEGLFGPAYEFALDLYWKLDSRDQQELTRLLENFLATVEKQYTGRG
ncbi:MAG: hypothetical protein ABIF77_11330 [bacterium]